MKAGALAEDHGRPFAQAANSNELSVARVDVAELDGEHSVLNLHWRWCRFTP